MNDRNGPASRAATALAESPLSQQGGAVGPASSIVGAPITGVGSAQSGVSPTASSAGEAAGTSPIGKVIHGRYRIKRLLGEGGMGGVYEGEHLEIGKRVAIKLVHALHARDPHIAARIKQEARSTGAIESEHIVQVFDAGEDEDLGLFLVMEMLKGEDLASLLLRKTRVSPMAAATMILQAAQGLLRAHAAGIVHRDLKPANIFLCTREDGSSLVKLVDFGIAKLVRDANKAQGQQGAGLTRMGMVIGTPQYMSPEQAQGLLTVDHRTDIYSLGAVLFETIVGVSPYPEMPTYEQTILQIMTRPAPRISSVVHDVHPELDQLCADMMAHDMNARPADMSVVRERLLRVFPQIEGGRLPMRSLTNEYDATVAADASGQIRAQVDAVLARSGLSGVGAAVQRPMTPPTSSPAVSARGAAYEEEPIDDVGGVPKKGNGLIVAVMIGFVVLGIGGGAAFMKMRAAPPPPPSAGYAIVQSTAAAPATPPAANAPPPTIAVAQTAAIPTAPAVATEPPVPAAADKPAPTKSHTHGSAKPSAAPGAPTPPAAPTENAPSRPVGGTGVSTEF
jgi:serine/threonine protein kinase